MERETVLMKIKAAESEARTRREKAEQEAAAIKEKAAREAASIVESAEKEGREMLKTAIDKVRTEEEEKRAARLDEADRQAERQKKEADEGKSRVIEMVTEIFMREYDV